MILFITEMMIYIHTLLHIFNLDGSFFRKRISVYKFCVRVDIQYFRLYTELCTELFTVR